MHSGSVSHEPTSADPLIARPLTPTVLSVHCTAVSNCNTAHFAEEDTPLPETIGANRERVSRRWTKAIGQPQNTPPPDGFDGLSPLEWAKRQEVALPLQAKALAETLGLAFRDDLASTPPSADFVEHIPIGFARQHGMLGLASEDGPLRVAVADLHHWRQLDVVARYLGRNVEPVLAPPDRILAAINAAYQQRDGQAQQMINTLDRREVLEELEKSVREDLLDVSGRAPVIKLVNLILFEAVKGRASDVHIQPYEEKLVVRMRIDGVLFDAFEVPKDLQDEVISRIKVIGRMNIAEKRLPQDGRATVQMGDRLVDLRIASLPVSHGERVVLRLLDKRARLYTLADLGMEPTTFARFRELIQMEHGLLLVTGPTGSGKSTTLYAALSEIDATDLNVLTLEDPIEYQLDGISQTQVSEKKGMTFASGLRSGLRQDPDIIMVGEIRDHETAVMAIQSALTGHLVFSTLHTNDAASAVTRLLDLGIEPYLVASSVVAVLAQRLVRRICPKCATSSPPSADDLRRLGLKATDDCPPALWRGTGCEACRHSGYRERVGVFELLVVDDVIRGKIQARANAAEIRDAALAGGMQLLRDDGLLKIAKGVTTIDEVAGVTLR